MPDVERLLDDITARLQGISGIEGVVLGGSRAQGTHHEGSDVDIGLYYKADEPIDIAALTQAAAEMDDEGRANLVTPIGGWGPWINGGGWLNIRGLPVDWLYRDLDRVDAVVADCEEGRIAVHYQPGHPHAFCSLIYMGEAAACRPLWDPNGRIGELKRRCMSYPKPLKDAVVSTFLWEAGFACANAAKGISRSDVSYVAGQLFRAASCLTQVLFAVNGAYLLNEKGAVAACAAFPRSPAAFEARVARGYSLLAEGNAKWKAAIGEIEALIQDTEALVNGQE